MCRALGSSKSGYYAWIGRFKSRREIENEILLLEIKKIHKQNDKNYGRIRIHEELKAQGKRCNIKRVARLMKENNIRAKTKRKFRVTTHSKHDHPISENLLHKEMVVTEPNKVWVSDITYILTEEGWLYLSVIIDLCSRHVVGWSMKDRLTRDLVIDAFNQAATYRKPAPGLIFHSDRGVQYACNDFRKVLAVHKCISSMSGKGNCYDNAWSESFFKTLKTELVYFRRYRTREEAKSSVFEYIEMYYNRVRRHSAIGYLSPAMFEQQLCQRAA